MRDMGLAIRSGLRLRADPSRVISRLFIPGQELVGGSEARTADAVERVLALSEADVAATLDELYDRFSKRHDDLGQVFERHAQRVDPYVSEPISANRRQLLGATFTHEYSLEGTSICNPSIVAHPDQENLAAGTLRIIFSYRTIGEGHHSAVCFRTGAIDSRGELTLDEPHPFPLVASISSDYLHRAVFHAKLQDLGHDNENAAAVLDGLTPRFSAVEFEMALATLTSQSDTRMNVSETVLALRSIANSFYVASFDDETDVSQRVLWPTTPGESKGMEDARFVRFDGDGVTRYLATYTAFDGHVVTQQLLETDDFATFVSSPLAGLGATNKGMAIFPRRLGGSFVTLSRHDRESNAIAYSSDLHHWNDVVTIQVPEKSWELIQLGNCGSPIELDEGWLVLTHGVGPMRTYGIGAILLDLDDPTKVLAQLPLPILLPDSDEQDGYVPNVVYSCGSLVHAGTLVVPYGISDQSISYATVKIADLMAAFVPVS